MATSSTCPTPATDLPVRQSTVSGPSQWLIIISIILASIIGIVLAVRHSDDQTQAFRLSPPQIQLVRDATYPHQSIGTLTLKNDMRSKIYALKIRTGCKCTVIDEVPESIDSGAQVSLNVTVQGSQRTTQLLLLDFQVANNATSIPVSEVTTLVSDAQLPSKASP